MFEELTAGQYEDWLQYHRQFNVSIDKPDIFSAIQIASFANAHRGEGDPEVRPVDVMPWVDPYDDDDAFFATLRGLAETAQGNN